MCQKSDSSSLIQRIVKSLLRRRLLSVGREIWMEGEDVLAAGMDIWREAVWEPGDETLSV